MLPECTRPLPQPSLTYQLGFVAMTQDVFYNKWLRLSVRKITVLKYTCKIATTSARGQWANRITIATWTTKLFPTLISVRVMERIVHFLLFFNNTGNPFSVPQRFVALPFWIVTSGHKDVLEIIKYYVFVRVFQSIIFNLLILCWNGVTDHVCCSVKK